MDVRTAAAVRQILFDSQKGYTYNSDCIPQRISQIREVIVNLDSEIEKIVGSDKI